MFLNKFEEKPSSKTCRILLIIGLIVCFTVIPIMQFFSDLSGFPASFISSQLSFNGDLLKTYYSVTDIAIYKIAPALDYFFMFGYGISIFTGLLLISRAFEKWIKIKKLGFLMGLFVLIAAICDGIENFFIFIMLSDISGFPNYIAILFSFFALIKWILLTLSLTWMILGGLLLIGKKIKSKYLSQN